MEREWLRTGKLQWQENYRDSRSSESLLKKPGTKDYFASFATNYTNFPVPLGHTCCYSIPHLFASSMQIYHFLTIFSNRKGEASIEPCWVQTLPCITYNIRIKKRRSGVCNKLACNTFIRGKLSVKA